MLQREKIEIITRKLANIFAVSYVSFLTIGMISGCQIVKDPVDTTIAIALVSENK